jgi:hypothetical protein
VVYGWQLTTRRYTLFASLSIPFERLDLFNRRSRLASLCLSGAKKQYQYQYVLEYSVP